MRQIFRRFRGDAIDHETAFEVTPNEVITHDRKASGFSGRKVEYTPRQALPLSTETQINLRLLDSGNGMCEVRTGEDCVDYHIHGEAQAFADEVKKAKDRRG